MLKFSKLITVGMIIVFNQLVICSDPAKNPSATCELVPLNLTPADLFRQTGLYF